MASRRSISWSSMVRCGVESDASRRTLKTNKIVAIASAAQATAMSTLLKVAFPGFPLRARQKFRAYIRSARGSELRFIAPVAHHEPHQYQRNDRHQYRHHPCQQIKTFLWRFDEHRGAILGHIRRQN